MEERNIDGDKMDEIMLPGFRFHPTDEELVGFYLRRKIELRSLPIELIKQLDIYKYDPWDLPKLATTGDKEWYFYCPRDRKYRNSARPNRVTGAGFWKATGTDRPIYSSESSKCIGLKKSLVFYRGRAAKGIKTDWMMHEFRLPSSTNDSAASRRLITKDIPANDAWAICRIFKKVNSTAQRATCHSWVSPVQPQTTPPGNPTHPLDTTTIFTSDNTIQFGDTDEALRSSKSSNFSPLHLLPYNYTNQIISQPGQLSISKPHQNLSTTSNFLPNEASNLLSNIPSSMFGDFESIPPQQISGYSCPLPQDLRSFLSHQEQMALENEWSVSNEQFGIIPSVGSFPFNLPLNFVWDSMPCPSDISSTFSTNKCYT